SFMRPLGWGNRGAPGFAFVDEHQRRAIAYVRSEVDSRSVTGGPLQPFIHQSLANAQQRDKLERARHDRLAGRSRHEPSLLARVALALRRQPAPAPARCSVVELAGPLDIRAARGVREDVSSAPDELVVDLADVTTVEPAGIEMLMEAAAAMGGRPLRFT